MPSSGFARSAATESASVEIGGSVVCGFFTSWGDGAFPVRRDLATDGTLCRLRVEVGAPEIVERQQAMEDRWFGELSRLRDLVDTDAALESLLRTSPPSAFERGPDGVFVPAEPPPPRG